ncbi:LLM class oxidoreductase [Pseudomonas sp. CHM02]|uniref:LLM class oxidoreductase n=1 Tax=Pseudomonas sp. CHM02 TaxID=1463662 RepID=UPI00046E7824|nr:LLM class oxidoreductase [Pseudomonas sp. CHM02]
MQTDRTTFPPGLESGIFPKVFRPGALTFGLIAPLEGYPGSASPTLYQHTELAKQADDQGFAAIWLRDVPFHDPSFGDVGQIFDPMVYGTWLAAATKKIAIGTAGIVLPLRDPLIVAKQAASLDHLTQSRFIMGLSTGDRPREYPAFGVGFENRAERFREAHLLMRAVLEQRFPTYKSAHYGELDGSLDLIPKPAQERLPTLAIGRCGQDIEWLAQNMDGWIWHQSNFDRLPEVINVWRRSCGPEFFKPYGYGVFFELDKNPHAPLRTGGGLHAGRNALIDLWKRQQDQGLSHVALNMRVSHRPVNETLDELAEYVLPQFAD